MTNEKHNSKTYEIPLGPVNLVFITTPNGLIGCGAFNANALDKFNYPAATIKSLDGSPIANKNDLLKGVINNANITAQKKGIKPDMPAKKALELL